MSLRLAGICAAALLAASVAGCAAPSATSSPSLAANPAAGAYGIVTVASAYDMGETVTRLKADVAAKGLMFFDEVDQQRLAADAGIVTQPSTLLVFGNPALGTQFITSNPQSGIDWPVRLLVFQDRGGQVWAEYTDFAYVAARHGIDDRDPQFRKASEVIASIADSVARK